MAKVNNDRDSMHISVSPQRGEELGAAIGSETGKQYGEVFASSTTTVLGVATMHLFGFLSLNAAPVILGIGGVSYLLGGYLGERSASSYCKKIGRDLARSGESAEAIVDICADKAMHKGVTAGLMITAGIGAVLIPILNCFHDPDTNLIGKVPSDDVDLP